MPETLAAVQPEAVSPEVMESALATIQRADSHLDLIRRFKVLFARYQRSRDLIAVGAYVPGSDPVLDQAIALYPRLESFLQQKLDERAGFAASAVALSGLF